MVIACAPVRISFGGGGTDLAAYYARFSGLVVSAAITRHSYVSVRPALDNAIRITSADYGLSLSYPHGELPALAEPLALPKAALAWLAAERGIRPQGIELSLAAEVPPGTGLGSSSAMTVALARALAAYHNLPMEQQQAAEIACEIEIERLAMPIGKQDQYASAFGGLNCIEFRQDGVTVTPLGLSRDALAALSAQLLLFSTGSSRDSASILRRQRAASLADGPVVEALHQIKALAVETQAALIAQEFDRFGLLLDQVWQVKRGLSRRISSAHIDRWYAAAREAGALGGKITGAGGGGFLLLYCPPRAQAKLRRVMAACGLQELAFDFDTGGARILDDTTYAVPPFTQSAPPLEELGALG